MLLVCPGIFQLHKDSKDSALFICWLQPYSDFTGVFLRGEQVIHSILHPACSHPSCTARSPSGIILSSLTSMVDAIFSVIYTKKHNIREPVAKISWKIAGCFTASCTAFVCLAGICVQIAEPPKANQVSQYWQSSCPRPVLFRRTGPFYISKSWRQSLRFYLQEGNIFYFESKVLQSVRLEKISSMDFLHT